MGPAQPSALVDPGAGHQDPCFLASAAGSPPGPAHLDRAKALGPAAGAAGPSSHVRTPSEHSLGGGGRNGGTLMDDLRRSRTEPCRRRLHAPHGSWPWHTTLHLHGAWLAALASWRGCLLPSGRAEGVESGQCGLAWVHREVARAAQARTRPPASPHACFRPPGGSSSQIVPQ